MATGPHDETQANNLLDSAARCAQATDALFEAITRRAQGELTPDEAITVTRDYVAAKEAFDNSITTGGLL